MVKIANPRTLTNLDEIRAAKPEMVFYSTKTCWWTANPDDLCCSHGNPMSTCPDGMSQLPVDPAGAPLFQTDEVELFLQDAESHPEHYGRHGLEAFILAYHGNIVSEDGLPRCAVGWDSYNKLLDEEESDGDISSPVSDQDEASASRMEG